jgi:hypothetical protein
MRRARLLVAVAVTAPVVAVVLPLAPASAAPDNCLSWIGARGTGQCIGESVGGLPQVGFNGSGIETSPLLPGQTFNIPLG